MTELIIVPLDARLDAVRQQLAQYRRAAIVLEIPEGWDGLANAARMRLVQRQAIVQLCQVAIATRDAATVRAAGVVGIPVFADVSDALARTWQMEPALPYVDLRNPALGLPEPPPWRTDKRRNRILARTALPSQFRTRQERIAMEQRSDAHRRPAWLTWVGYGAFAVLLFSLLGLFARYVLPAATVTLRPGTQHVAVTARLQASPDLTESDIANARIQGRLVETVIEEAGIATTSGALQKPTIKARGEALFSNLGTAPVKVPVGTQLSTGTGTPVAFRTLAEAEIPGGVGQRVSIPIEAIEPGIEGNVRANTITNIDGPLRFRARVSNSNGTGGGGSELVKAVTQADKDALLEETLARAEARAYQALQEKIEAGEWLPAESVQTFVVAQAFDQYNDDAADQVNLTLRLLVQGVAVDEAEARDVLQAAVQKQIPQSGKLVADSLVAQRIPGAQAVGRGVEFTMTVGADYVIPVETAEVRSAVAGMSEEEAASVLQERWLLAAPPEFYRDPEWLKALPALPSRIQVRVEYEQPISAVQ